MALRRSELEAEAEDPEQAQVGFPVRLAEAVIDRYSDPGDVVLDPFAGFGTTGVAAARLNRRAILIELLPERAELVRRRLAGEARGIGDDVRVIVGDARALPQLVSEPVQLCFTSPPYMTRTAHPENPLTGYRTLDAEYGTYLDELDAVFRSVARLLVPGGHLVVNVATVLGPDGPTYLADDLGARLRTHLVQVDDLRIAWDAPLEEIEDDSALVFRASGLLEG